MRTQLPLRLAYHAMTYNRAQGETLERGLLDITTPPYTHGHLYVGSSRNTDAYDISRICLFLGPTKDLYLDPITNESLVPLVTNVVYPDELRDLVL